MALLYILAIFLSISFQLNHADGDCSNNPRGLMGDDEYCTFCADPDAKDKHDCAQYYNPSNPKSNELLFDSEEEGGCALKYRIGVRIKCQSVPKEKTYYYISAHGAIVGEYEEEEDIFPKKDKTWRFDSNFIIFKCPGTEIAYEESDDVQKLLEKGQIEAALKHKKHEYTKHDKIYEYVFYYNTEFPSTGGIHQLTVDAHGKVKNIELLHEFIPAMEYNPVKLFDAAEVLHKNGLKPGTIFWLACNSWQDQDEAMKFTEMSQLPAGPKTTKDVETRRNKIFVTTKQEIYDPLYKEVTDKLSKRKSKLEAAIGKKKIGDKKYEKANTMYQQTKAVYIDPIEKHLQRIIKPVDYYNIGWYVEVLRKANDAFIMPGLEYQLGSITKAVSAKQEYVGNYYDYDYDGYIGYGKYDDYDANDDGMLGYYQQVLRKMRKEKKHRNHIHHKHHSDY